MPPRTRWAAGPSSEAVAALPFALLDLPLELLHHVVQGQHLRTVLNARASCLLLQTALSAPVVWRSLADTLLLAHPHVAPPPLFPRLGIEPSLRWLLRLLAATRCRFGRDDAAHDRGTLRIPNFGSIPSSLRAAVDVEGLVATQPLELDDAALESDHRAELAVPAGLGAVTLAIDMSESSADGVLYDHFVYLRRGTEGLVCYWLASAGLHYLHLDLEHSTCRLERAEETHIDEAGERQASNYEVLPDERLRGADPKWHDGRIPAGAEQLFVGVTLWVPRATAALRQIVLR
mmetsp:Transcript_26221/g.87362  ORF Transcript_26221/g.87362 Transcript_26221/m.87362 type:complete len:290 (-) Transcript_26221:71-940(-)